VVSPANASALGASAPQARRALMRALEDGRAAAALMACCGLALVPGRASVQVRPGTRPSQALSRPLSPLGPRPSTRSSQSFQKSSQVMLSLNNSIYEPLLPFNYF
jgi:hypothetical protein